MRLDIFVKLKYESSTIIFVNIRYSMSDVLSTSITMPNTQTITICVRYCE